MRQIPLAGRIAAWLLAAATLLVAALAVYHVIAICHTGFGPENQPTPGVFVQPVFAPETVAAHLAQMAWACWLWLAACVCAIAVRWRAPAGDRPIPRKRAMSLYAGKAAEQSRMGVIRAVLLAVSAALIVAGIINGGMWDVLVKAINICTECIGLG